MDEAIALYRKSVYDGTREVRILIFQDALQLYDVLSQAYLVAIPLSYIHHVEEHLTHTDVFFSHSDDVKITLPKEHPLLEEIRSIAGKKVKFRLSTGKKVAILTIVVIASIIALYLLFINIVPSIGLKLISKEREIAIGNQMFDATIQGMADERKSRAFQDFADQLKLSDEYPIKVHVVISDEINAYAVPGGNIVVYTALLNRMEHYSELVALLGHEVSHVNERHSLRSILKSISSTVFLSILVGDVSAVGGALLTNADKLRGLSYSRSLEKEADEEGLKVMQRNNVDVNGMLKMFERLKAADKGEVPMILSSHPLTDARIRYTKDQIKEISQDDTERKDLEELWRQLKPPAEE